MQLQKITSMFIRDGPKLDAAWDAFTFNGGASPAALLRVVG